MYLLCFPDVMYVIVQNCPVQCIHKIVIALPLGQRRVGGTGAPEVSGQIVREECGRRGNYWEVVSRIGPIRTRGRSLV